MAEYQKNSSDDVIISIAEDDKNPHPPKHRNHKPSLDSPTRLSNDSTFSPRKSVQSNSTASPNKPPRIPKHDALTRRKTLSRSVYSKPKSRFGEQSMPIDSSTLENDALFEDHLVSSHGSPITKIDSNRAMPIMKKKRKEGKEKKEKQVIDINKLHQMKQDKVSAWTMKMLVDVISNSGLTTLSNAIDESVYGGGNAQMDKEINNEEEAIAAAYHIFRNVAQPGCKYIDELDLIRFMSKEEVEIVFPMIDVAEVGQIDRKTLTDWVVKVYEGRKALAHALTDTKTAVKQLNKLVSGILVAIMILVWLLLVGIATTKVLVFLSSQLVLAVFVFGNTCKTIFEAIIFVFIMHPFDVGDRCVIDGVQMIVEEMNILTTVFLRYDNEKIYYPNSVLATKPISNFYRSPDMGDSLEFSIDFKTPLEKIGTLKLKIKQYLENNPQHWHPNHSVVVKEIENVNKIKMALYFNHTMNFQNYSEKSRRKTGLVLEMKRIFEELSIRYDLLPQEVRLVETKRATTETDK
ncbi:mechanosensitive ion channel protein 10 [Phtheirospermum japonicum]|uniref:Mechanosensitive ion channel protein 10 n=1 Tax=Phtheirospermum japonicum TaxID=374723 RepID=A0A830CKM8_9LAMI|nr:mechanosensitive ion channel protein 10 [Phtheirospermum japonicum]